ncbi:MAG: DNA glycosylase [Methanomicrobiales archaeon]|nr:DNA glycosylase [Methanomicrobiales archaeon]
MCGELQELLRQWGDAHFRDYPWRHTRDPYRIMIAEFMLHRTKADQVVPVYIEFLKEYPDVFSLAEADISEVRKVTEHLGLHWRSGHFIMAARYIVEKWGGKFPETEEELREIPGVGEYVAGAILIVCYGKPYPAIDSNIARFINRFYGLHLSGEIRRRREIIKSAREIFSIQDPDQFLFAVLDFTAVICKSQNPLHENCPLRDICKYYQDEIRVLKSS